MFTRNHIADKPGHRTGYSLFLIGCAQPPPLIVSDEVTVERHFVTFRNKGDVVAEFFLNQIAGYRLSIMLPEAPLGAVPPPMMCA